MENSIFDLQRDWATPVPRVKDFEQLNAYLRQCCLKKLDHRVAGKTETVKERFQQDKQAALALPKHPFEPYVAVEVKADKYLTFSRTGAELLFQVFADRYERGSLLITSNLAFSEWVQTFQG